METVTDINTALAEQDAQTVKPAGYAATAAEFLDMSAEGSDSLAALQGIGYALLAVVDQLADVADTGADCCGSLDEIAERVADLAGEPLGSRVLGAFGHLVRRARPWGGRPA